MIISIERHGDCHPAGVWVDVEPPSLYRAPFVNFCPASLREEGDRDGTFVWAESERVFSFGLWSHDPRQRPGDGGLWSSRAECVGRYVTHEAMVDVYATIDDCRMAGYAMRLSDIRDQLPAGYVWARFWHDSEFVAHALPAESAFLSSKHATPI